MVARYPGAACFWLERTDRVSVGLRRYVSGNSRVCRANGSYCQAVRPDVLGEHPFRSKQTEHGVVMDSYDDLMPKRTSRRWPRRCDACGETLGRGTRWQVIVREVYVRSDTGAEVAFRGYADKSMAGALYDGWWLHDRTVVDAQGQSRGYVGPDGIALIAVCPNGLAWEVDGPSRSQQAFGPGWTRSGDPRRPETLTVSPSIVAGDYHGFLQNGRFTDDLGS